MKSPIIIGTWDMAENGIRKGYKVLKDGGSVKDALIETISDIEDNENFVSVGYGGLPNINGELELDAAYMDGADLSLGAVISLKNFKNPFKVAVSLHEGNYNNVLTGEGAALQAIKIGEKPTCLLTTKSLERWQKESHNLQSKQAYDGHDTVCIIAINNAKHMACGVSTSGLFMKKVGRVGDSPIVGSGFYVDDEIGSAAATGVGEEIMKGCLSYEIVRLINDGHHPKKACEIALLQHIKRLERANVIVKSMSVLALNNQGDHGGASNIDTFVYWVGSDDCVHLHSVKNLTK